MFRSRALRLLKLIPLMSGQSNLACKFIHPVIASHGRHCHRSVIYRQRYRMHSCSAGRRAITAETKVGICRAPFILWGSFKCFCFAVVSVIFEIVPGVSRTQFLDQRCRWCMGHMCIKHGWNGGGLSMPTLMKRTIKKNLFLVHQLVCFEEDRGFLIGHLSACEV